MKKIISIIEYIVAFLIILDCYSVYFSLFASQMKIIIIVSIIMLFIVTFLYYKQDYINLKRVILFFVFYSLGAIIMLLYSVDEDNLITYISRFLIMIPVLSIYFSIINSNSKNRLSLLYKLSEIMTFLAIISVIMWIIVSCMGKIQPTGYVPHVWADRMSDNATFLPHYYYIYFETQHIDILRDLGNIYRNTGIFNEGPMYVMCLCISLITELFLRERIEKWRIVVIVITILTVFSTTGYIFLLLTFTCFIFSKKLIRKKSISLLVVLILLCVYMFIELVLPQKEETSSYQVRNEAAFEGIRIWESAPIFGIGYANTTGTMVRANGIWRILADGGIYFFLLYIASFFLIPCYYCYRKYIDRGFLFVFLLAFFLLYPTVVQYKCIILMFISLAFSFIIQKKPNFRQDFTNNEKNNFNSNPNL